MFAIGLMSGTSMDGVDAALLETDGTSALIRPVAHVHVPYDPLFKTALRSAEALVYRLQATLPRTELDQITQQSTQWHARAVNALLKQTGLCSSAIDVIGYHGQTLLHRPRQRISVIIGDGQQLADTAGITVVNDFRRADIEAGGEGAPFAPLYHHALAVRDNRLPLVIVNCGGIANITLIEGRDPSSSLSAFDTGPGNALIDRMVRLRTQNRESMDADGKYGRKGRLHQEVLKRLHAEAVIQHDKNYLLQLPPKSLDTHDMRLPPCLDALSIEDACNTLEWFTAETIVQSLDFQDTPPPAHWILAGGGWNNPVIRESLTTLLQKRIGSDLILQTSDEQGWQSQAMEAQLFAWLAVRSLQGLPLSLPRTTGVPKPLTGGTCYFTKRAGDRLPCS